MTPPIRMVSVPVDDLAQEIRRVDGNHDLGAGALAEALLPFLSRFTAAHAREEGGAVDVGREAIWKLVHEVWQLLDEAETDSAGITTPDQERWQAVSEAMDALEALVPDSAGPFWGGFPVNYFWPALATRHEAPAEAGEIGAEYDTAAHCVTLAECPPGLFLWNGMLGFKSEYGAMKPDDATSGKYWKVGNQPDAYCADSGEYFWGGASNENDRAKLLVYPISAEIVAMVASHGHSDLRAQPPAREDAQPVASAYRVRPERDDPEEWALMHPERAFDYLGRSGWETQPLYTHPAPDALREAVKALELAAIRFDEIYEAAEVDDVAYRNEATIHGINGNADVARSEVRQALAALQAEQGAK